MMKMRQQPDSSTYTHKISKQRALFVHNNNNRGSSINRHEAGFISMMSASYGVDYERDESPVSVISHSASVISQPSSACTSMEHHLMLNPELANPKFISNQSSANPLCAYKQDQLSVGTSAASTSEDDGSAYNLPTLFFEVTPLPADELSKTQKPVCSKNVIGRGSSKVEEAVPGTQQNSTKPIKRKSLVSSEATSVAESLKSDDDEHMISIDLEGLQENSSVLREKFLRGNANKLSKFEEEKQAEDKLSATYKKYDEWKREQKLDRSTSNGHAALVERLHNGPAEKTNNLPVNHVADRATTYSGMYEAESLKEPPSVQKYANSFAQKPPPILASRQRSINSTRSSKWDDAEKWLCYDNHASPHHKVKNSLQKLHSNYTPSDPGVLSVNKASNECKDNCASPNRGNLGANKVYEFKHQNGLKDDVAFVSVATHPMMQSSDIILSRGSLSIDVIPGGKHVCSSQSLNYGILKSKMLEDDDHRRNWFGSTPGACGKGDCDYLSSGEMVTPHVLGKKLAAFSVSDGEIYANNASPYQHYQASCTSISSGSISGGESKKKDHYFKATFERWKKDNSNELVAQHERMRECDYLSSGELLSRANDNKNPTTISRSDGEMYGKYTSDQQYRSNASYTQRFKQHQLLQKLRRKCSPISNGGHKGPVEYAKEDGSPNFIGKNVYGRVASVHTASRLSISTQASPSKDQFSIQGEYARTYSVGKQENEPARDESVCINAEMQREFVVQTPTHGRSASMKDACTEVSPTLSRRDMGTQMTPSESSPTTSKCNSPMQNASPARHNTPTRTSPPLNPQNNNVNTTKDDEDGTNLCVHRVSRCNNGNALELESCHWAKLELRDLPSGGQTTSEKTSDLGSAYNEWSPALGVEEEIAIGEEGHESDAVVEMHSGGIIKRLSVLDARAAAWEDAERAKFHAKYKREEARIKAWETLQKAKAEAELKKLEVKLERLRSRATEKVLSKVAAAERRAEEMRAAAEAQQAEQMRKVRERACNLRKTALFPGSFAVCFARNYMP